MFVIILSNLDMVRQDFNVVRRNQPVIHRVVQKILHLPRQHEPLLDTYCHLARVHVSIALHRVTHIFAYDVLMSHPHEEYESPCWCTR